MSEGVCVLVGCDNFFIIWCLFVVLFVFVLHFLIFVYSFRLQFLLGDLRRGPS